MNWLLFAHHWLRWSAFCLGPVLCLWSAEEGKLAATLLTVVPMWTAFPFPLNPALVESIGALLFGSALGSNLAWWLFGRDFVPGAIPLGMLACVWLCDGAVRMPGEPPRVLGWMLLMALSYGGLAGNLEQMLLLSLLLWLLVRGLKGFGPAVKRLRRA